LPHGERGADAFLEEGFIDGHAFGREEAHEDFGFGIVEADAEQALAVVLDLDERAIRGGMGDAENRTAVNPGMPANDAVRFAGTQ